MKKILRVITLAALLPVTHGAIANWSTSAGYASFNDISLGAVYGSVGYTFQKDEFTIMPELRLGLGINDTTIDIDFGGPNDAQATYEIDNFVSASLRGQINVSETIGIFIQPSFSMLTTTIFESSSEFTLGLGASFEITESASIEAMYESFDRSDVLSLGIRYSF
jgi:opacity protein-like surface antigen